MGKREARIARKNQKILERQEKSARLVEAVVEDMRPRIAGLVEASTVPRLLENPKSIMQMRMEYRMLDSADRDGEWSWGQHRNWCSPKHGPDNACAVRSLMIEMSGLYWHEIHDQRTGGKDRHKKHHSQSWDSLCAEAQTRWVEIERDEDELFRFRAGGTGRVWGYRSGQVFFVVWWDPEHKIYPLD